MNQPTDISAQLNELLVMLGEECSEVNQAAMKICRSGFDYRPYGGVETNREKLEKELEDVYTMVHILQQLGEIGPIQVSTQSITRRLRYTRHQGYELPPE